ncbi:hypothetical protein SEMRO_2410_G326670.1 [Seminavis robusta]|uniref:Uncharacterized protein n=1 Tax=Seminavis robusta TaxID=568900 RepID=A0A9N8EZE6_9STRA|nr:hypothetical protein SEMRO_2410_G326670.1 [Seminavis robusta]|eukprot:Sro2410_g326670.1 n/a (422) ;mRNA; r:3952-5305
MQYKVKLCGSKVSLGIHGFCVGVTLWEMGNAEPISMILRRKGLQFAQVLEALPEWPLAPNQPQQKPVSFDLQFAMSNPSPTTQDPISCSSKNPGMPEAHSNEWTKHSKNDSLDNAKPSVEDPAIKDNHDDNEEGDDVWKYLCLNHWGCGAANELLQATEMTPKSYFLTFAYPTPSHNVPAPLPPPKYAPKDNVLIVDVRTMDNQILFSKAIPGNAIPEFFSGGETKSIHLQETVWGFHDFEGSFSSYQHFYDDQFLPGSYADFCLGTHWKGTVHLMRLPDRKVIQFVDVSESDDEIGPPDSDEDKSQHILVTSLISSGCKSELATGRSDQTLFPHMGIHDSSSIYEDGGMETCLTMEYKVKLSGSNVSLGIHGFCVHVTHWEMACGEPISDILQTKGLQFAQVLEALPEWQFAPIQPQQKP